MDTVQTGEAEKIQALKAEIEEIERYDGVPEIALGEETPELQKAVTTEVEKLQLQLELRRTTAIGGYATEFGRSVADCKYNEKDGSELKTTKQKYDYLRNMTRDRFTQLTELGMNLPLYDEVTGDRLPDGGLRQLRAANQMAQDLVTAQSGDLATIAAKLRPAVVNPLPPVFDKFTGATFSAPTAPLQTG